MKFLAQLCLTLEPLQIKALAFYIFLLLMLNEFCFKFHLNSYLDQARKRKKEQNLFKLKNIEQKKNYFEIILSQGSLKPSLFIPGFGPQGARIPVTNAFCNCPLNPVFQGLSFWAALLLHMTMMATTKISRKTALAIPTIYFHEFLDFSPS